MAIIDSSVMTIDTQVATAMSEALFQRALMSPQLREFITVTPGIKGKKQLPIYGRMGLAGKKATSGAPTPNPNGIKGKEKIWEPVYIDDRFAESYVDLGDTFFQWGLKNGIAKADLTSTDYANFVEDQVLQAIKEAQIRLSFFSDTDIIAGDLTGDNAALVKYFNPIDGIFKQVFEIVAANANQRVTIAKNTGVNKAAQMFDATDTTNQVVTGYLQNLVFNAPFELRQSKDLVIPCTQSIADQYSKERQKITGIPTAYERTETGIPFLQIEGVKLIPIPEWDKIIRTYFDDGTKYNLPHRALLYPLENVMFGTEDENSLDELKAFYDEYHKEYVVDFGFNMDAKVGLDNLIMAAY